jgi:hypothetical protein
MNLNTTISLSTKNYWSLDYEDEWGMGEVKRWAKSQPLMGDFFVFGLILEEE